MISPSSFLRNASPHRRYLSSRRSSKSSTRNSPAPSCLKLQSTTITTPPSSRRGSGIPVDADGMFNEELLTPVIGETDAECWQRMLTLQREYHCYNSARLEAAVEAEERGEGVVNVPSRLCLDLLNDSLWSWIKAYREGSLA